MPALPTDTIEALDKVINDQHLPVLVKVSKLFKSIADHGLGYYQKIMPKDTLTHPANRGGSLLNSSDVWSKGLRMLQIGVQPAMLQSGAVCFELSNDKDKRERQIAANVALVEGRKQVIGACEWTRKIFNCCHIPHCCFLQISGARMQARAECPCY